jgi:leucyl-tRNA synthetase
MRISTQRTYARELRKDPTPTEAALWQRLKGRRLLGIKFRRQFPILIKWHGSTKHFYIADFCCCSKKMIIELDGPVHSETKEYDEMRAMFLNEKGYTILRFQNDKVEADLEECLRKIIEMIRKST